MRKKAGFQHTSPWYLGNNTARGWCGNYTPHEREKFSPGTYWLHHVLNTKSTESSETWVSIYKTVRRPIPEDSYLGKYICLRKSKQYMTNEERQIANK